MPKLKPETLNVIKGNDLTIDNLWLGAQIEKRTLLHFFFSSENTDFIAGVLLGMGRYNYLVAASGEIFLNKAHITRIQHAP